MLWLSLSLLTALSVALRDVSVRAYEDLTAADAALMEMLWVLPALILLFPFIPRPPLDDTFWIAFLLTLPIDIASYLMYLQAIKVSPLSLTVPFLSFTPLFMMLTGRVILGESVSPMGGLGILLIASGSYVLNMNRIAEGLHAPITAILREKGSLLMLGVAFLYSFSGALGKKAILHSSALYFSFLYNMVFILLVCGSLLAFRKTSLSRIRPHRLRGGWLGALLFIHITCHGLAIESAKAAYMIAVKRTSVLFSILFGALVLKEDQMRFRGTGTVLMFLGAVVIALYG